MSKINVLVVPSDRTGVGKFRSIDPHIFLQNLYPEDFHIDIVYDVAYDDLEFFKKYQIVSFHRSIGPDFERANRLIQTLNSFCNSIICECSFSSLFPIIKSGFRFLILSISMVLVPPTLFLLLNII